MAISTLKASVSKSSIKQYTSNYKSHTFNYIVMFYFVDQNTIPYLYRQGFSQKLLVQHAHLLITDTVHRISIDF